MLENLGFSNNFDFRNINSYSVLDEMNPDIFSQLPKYENFIGYPYIYPKPINSIKLIVSDSSAVIPNGPFEYIINNVQMGNNTIQINNANIISAFNNSPQGYTFDINVQTIYDTYGNADVVVNNFSQYTK
jgi:hypothetical protein